MSDIEILNIEHVGLSVASLEDMTEWYSRALGMAVEHSFESSEWDVKVNVMRGAGVLRIELVEKGGSHPNPEQQNADLKRGLEQRGYGHVALRVRNISDVYQSLVDAGAQPVFGEQPSLIAQHRFAYVLDPEGNQIELLEYED